MKMVFLTDPESAAGYRLAGLETVVAQDPDEAREALVGLVQSDDYALVAVNTALVPDPYLAVKKEMRGRDLPILLALPSYREITGDGEDAEGYMRRLIRDTLGYEIKL